MAIMAMTTSSSINVNPGVARLSPVFSCLLLNFISHSAFSCDRASRKGLASGHPGQISHGFNIRKNTLVFAASTGKVNLLVEPEPVTVTQAPVLLRLTELLCSSQPRWSLSHCKVI